MSCKPKYRAYKPVKRGDGLHNWVESTFDNTVEWTAGDSEKFEAMLLSLRPEARIKSMQQRLDNLGNMTPAIKVHVDAIRAIHAGLGNHFNVTREELGELDKADELWGKIMVLRDMLPKAIMGAKHSKVQSDRAKAPRKLSEENIKNILARYLESEREGSVYGVVKQLARVYGVSTRTINNVIKTKRPKD